MRILILTQYFPPETGAPQNRLFDLGRRLAQWGHEVTALTALPNYPTGEIFPAYRRRWYAEERLAGMRVLRTWVYVRKSRGFVSRLANYFSFVLTSILAGGRIGQQDAVIVESPPLFLGISGFVLSRWQHARLVFNVSDLWPESAVAMGVLRNRVLIRLSTMLEMFVYRHSSQVTGQTEGIVGNIRARVPNVPVALITNGVDLEEFHVPAGTRERERERHGFGGRFVAAYAGLHGLGQGLHTVLQAAEILRDREDVLFAFFGDGPEKERLMNFARQKALANVRFFPAHPKAAIPGILAACDAAVVPLKRLELFKGALPSKLFEAMAAARPVLLAVEGEARVLLESARAGICIPPEDSAALAAAVLRLSQDAELCDSLGANGRQFVAAQYNREHIARRFEQILQGAASAADALSEVANSLDCSH